MNKAEDIEKWYDDNKNLYDTLAQKVAELLGALISDEKIPYHSITERVKTKDSFLEKCQRKKYDNPKEEVMDLAGIRIIAYTTSDVDKICKLIKKEFVIDESNSGNKADLLKSDKVGYLSVHYIASFLNERTCLGEYKRFSNLKFEIQVRTLLQHAWAEIEHDRSYKFSGVLPENIRRRFHLIAGVLEMVDSEFQRLSDEIDIYSQKIKLETKKGNLELSIDSTSLNEFLSQNYNSSVIDKTFNGADFEVIDELHNFGINTIIDLSPILTEDFTNTFIRHFEKEHKKTNFTGFLREAMIFADTKKYFQKSWQHHWQVYSPCIVRLWETLGTDINLVNKYVHLGKPFSID